MQWGYGTMSGYGKIKKETEKQNKEGNPLLLHGQSHFAPQNKEGNPLLLHGQSHFAPQNKED